MFSNTLTIVVMAVWTIIALWGFYRGAMRTVISISILIISIAAAVFVSPKVNDMFTSSKTVNAMAMQRSEKFVEARIRNLEDGSGDLDWAEYLPLPEGVRDVVREGDPAVVGLLLRTETVKTYLSELISGFLIRILSIIVTFIVTYLLMCIVRIILAAVSEAPVISGLNHFAGLILGVIKGAVIIWILFALLRLSYIVGGTESALLGEVRESEVLSVMYAYNPVFTILPRVLGFL
ncbi:MAG: CvpA family protein [Lachnospiraceae bacterium]|jgi:uncharacterized membrane protein required for colicin V production|nr:CvpA family protein [Lachnospiraceae bacterium]